VKSYKFILILGIILIAGLALKSLKQFVYLSFTLLSLKVAWVGLIIVIILMSLKKRMPSSREARNRNKYQ
jgi:hypothetical protein